MGIIRPYLLSVTAASVICAILNNLAGKQSMAASVMKLLTGLFLAVCAMMPLLQFGSIDLASAYTDIALEGNDAVKAGEVMAYESVCDIIKQRTESYILDKAAAMDLGVDVEVILEGSDPPQPSGVNITADISPYAKEVLSHYIADTLGIPKENQSWHTKN